MSLMYFIDNRLKRYMVRGKGYCSPTETGRICDCLACIREYDVNIWLYFKGSTIIAFDSGHLNYPYIDDEFSALNIDRRNVKSVFLTHADNDHAGGIDTKGRNIFPEADIYIRSEEKTDVENDEMRFKMGLLKLSRGISLPDNVSEIHSDETIMINDISIEPFFTPGHTKGHTCYIIDNKVLISGDCLAVNAEGGYSFFDFFTQNPQLNKKSLKKLAEHIQNRPIEFICTGHSGAHRFTDKVFRHIDKGAVFSRKKVFDPFGPYDPFSA